MGGVNKYFISDSSFIQQVISAIRLNDLLTPVKRLANERYKMKHRGVDRSLSIYRDILFLAMTAIGTDNIDLSSFHREYAAVFDKLTEKECNLYYRSQDLPPSASAIYCRAYFKPLQLPWHMSDGVIESRRREELNKTLRDFKITFIQR